MDKREIAERLLKKDITLNVDMLQCIRRGSADIIVAEESGVLLQDKISNIYMIFTLSEDFMKSIINKILDVDTIVLHNEFEYKLLKDKINFSEEMICYNAVYLQDKYIEQSNFEIKIEVLKEEFIELVKNNYSELSLCNGGYIEERVKDKEMYGAFLGNKLAGFIGTHEEGSIGMLEVIPEFRGKGIGSELERYAINRAIAKGRYPYCQVKEDNEISMKLQKSLGMEISKTKVYWLFK